MMTRYLIVTFLFLGSSLSSYIPPYYEGTPTAVSVVRVDPPDYRGEESFRIEFALQPSKDGMPTHGFVHRTWEDFKKFDRLLTTHLLNFNLDFPDDDPSLSNLDAYLKRVITHQMILTSNSFNDFLGINWSGKDLTFLQDLPGFLYVVIPPLYRFTSSISFHYYNQVNIQSS